MVQKSGSSVKVGRFFRYLPRISGDACKISSINGTKGPFANQEASCDFEITTLKMNGWNPKLPKFEKENSSEPNLNCWVQSVHFAGYNKVTRWMCHLCKNLGVSRKGD